MQYSISIVRNVHFKTEKKIKNDYKRKKVILRARFTCDIYAELIGMTKYVNVISSSQGLTFLVY